MTCRTTHHAGCECHEQRHAEEIARLTRERDDARRERNVLAARVETYSAEASRLRGEVQRLATDRARADHLAALLEAQGKELERMRIELANVTADRDKEHAVRRDYEYCITFDTSCLYCARMLSTCRTAEERAERAEAIIEGRAAPPDEDMLAEHRRKHPPGWWLIGSDPRLSERFVATYGFISVEFASERLSELAERCRARNLPWRWIPLRVDARPAETPCTQSMPADDFFCGDHGVQLPDKDRMYAAVVEHARQLASGEEPDDFAIMRKIDAEKKR